MDFKSKTEEIVAVGEANRGMVRPEGAPKRLYDFWLDNTGSKKGRAIRYGERRENFCHFWRVVAIWAPLMWLGKKVEAFLDMKYTMPIIGAILVVGFILGIFFGGGVFGLGVLLAVLAGAVVLVGTIVGVGTYLENHPKVARAVAWAIFGAIVAVVLGLFLWATGFVGIGILLVGGLLALVVRANMERIADWIEAKRRAEEERQRELRRMRRAAAEEFRKEHGYYPEDAPAKEPGRVSKFFRGVGDFIIMGANVIRVNKWKICPIMDINDAATRGNDSWEAA